MAPPLSSLFEFGAGFGRGVYGAGKGMVEGAAALREAGWDLLTDETARARAGEALGAAGTATADYAGRIAEDPSIAWNDLTEAVGAAGAAASEAAGDAYDFARTASPGEWGEAAGGGATHVATAVVPLGAAAKVAGLGRLGGAGKAASGPMTRAARTAAERAKGLPDAPPGAVALCDEVAAIRAAMPKELTRIPTSGVPLRADPARTTTILGRYDDDMKHVLDELGYPETTDFGPNKGGFNVLNAPKNLYKNPEQFWDEYNRAFIDRAIERDDNFTLATTPKWDTLTRRDPDTKMTTHTGFGREFRYLREKGYRYDRATQTMVRE